MSVTPTLRKTAWPKYIADALGIPTVLGSGGPWHSTGDTTDLVWFERMCEALAVPYGTNRVTTMQALVESVGGAWDAATMSSELTRSRGGGNVKVAAFEALWLGLQRSMPGRNALDGHDAMSEVTRQHEDEVDSRRRALRLIRLRQGQPAFRSALLEAYGNRCAVTGADAIEVLEAAHIVPFSAGGPASTHNGLLLRADIHTLFDLGLIAVDTKTWQVVVHPKILMTAVGAGLAGRSVRLPTSPEGRPSPDRLDEHRRACGL